MILRINGSFEFKYKLSEDIGKLLIVLSGVFLCIVGLTIFQDFLESKRNGYPFYFNESILFKTIWFLFIPILAVLHKKLENETFDSFRKTMIFIVTPIVVHVFILPFVAVVFSVLFYVHAGCRCFAKCAKVCKSVQSVQKASVQVFLVVQCNSFYISSPPGMTVKAAEQDQ